MRTELKIFHDFIRGSGLRRTSQRERILDAFLAEEGHVSVEELHGRVSSRDPRIGYTTVYRTMKLLLKLGLCRAIDLGDGVSRFEHEYGHRHHDHLICTACGACVEVFDQRIEKLKNGLARTAGFTPVSHTLRIYGECRACASEKKRARVSR